MKDLTAKPCNLFQKIAVTLLMMGVVVVLGRYILTQLWQGLILPVLRLINWIDLISSMDAVPENALWSMILSNFSLIDNANGLISLGAVLCLPLPLLLFTVYVLFLSKKKIGGWILASAFLMLGGVALLLILTVGLGFWGPLKRLFALLVSIVGDFPAQITWNLPAQLLSSTWILVQNLQIYSVMTLACGVLAVCSLFGLRPEVLVGITSAVAALTAGTWLWNAFWSVSLLMVSMVRDSGEFINIIGTILSTLYFGALLVGTCCTVLVLIVRHSPVPAFARKKKAEIPAEV